MKQIISILVFVCVCALTAVFTSCSDSKQDAVSRLTYLYQDVRTNSKNFNAEQWNAFLSEYKAIETELSQYTFDGEERNEISRLKGRCAAYAREATMVVANRQLSNTLLQTRGTFE